jgi:hypothetical protein
MKSGSFFLLAILTLTVPASAQDWQHCKPEGSYSFTEVKDAVHRVTTSHIITGWDEKTFNRSGDLVPLAIVQTLSDTEMTSPQTLEEVLFILRQPMLALLVVLPRPATASRKSLCSCLSTCTTTQPERCSLAWMKPKSSSCSRNTPSSRLP